MFRSSGKLSELSVELIELAIEVVELVARLPLQWPWSLAKFRYSCSWKSCAWAWSN